MWTSFFFHGSTALVCPGLLWEVPRSHSDTPHSVGLLWTSDRPVAGTSTWLYTHNSKATGIHTADDIRTRNPRKRVVVDPRLRPHGNCDRHIDNIGDIIILKNKQVYMK